MGNPYAGEFKRYKRILGNTLEQLSDSDFFRKLCESDNSVAIILKHITGNLKSRFTDFLTSDGEKKWRNRDSEFVISSENREHLQTEWEKAWSILMNQISSLSTENYNREITIRGVKLTVEEALCRSLSHFSYHVGEIVFIGKHLIGKNWAFQSIPPGGSAEYNKNPFLEKID